MTKTLEKIIAYAAMVAEPEKIILFGSMADNKANIFSDVDLLIITSDKTDKRHVSSMIESFSKELSLKTDVLIYSKAEIEKEVLVPNSFLAGIVKAGKAVWSDGMQDFKYVIPSINSVIK